MFPTLRAGSRSIARSRASGATRSSRTRTRARSPATAARRSRRRSACPRRCRGRSSPAPTRSTASSRARWKAASIRSSTWRPVCQLERVPLDLSNVDARRGLFSRLGRSASNVMVLTEGLLIYLMAHEVCALGADLADAANIHHWVVDIVSPGLLGMLKEQTGALVAQAGAPYLFAPAEGPAFFERCGWRPVEVKSMLKTANALGRLSLKFRLFAMLPEPAGPAGSRPWSGVCLLARAV